jgi:hypothetical protein
MTMLKKTFSLRALAGVATLAAAQLGCDPAGQKDPISASVSATPGGPTAASPSASAEAIPGIVVGIPVEPREVAKVVDPKGEPPYAGPTGTLRGVIRVSGDAPPELPVKIADTPCRGEAAATHGKLFRVGQDGALADALVAVTGYSGYVPPREPVAKLTIHGCSFARRTLVATFGQRIEVANLDKLETYMPFLDGAPVKAVLVAIPGGDAVRLYPPQPGRYLLRDQLPHDYMTAEVFVLAYATHDVSGLDGKYEITGIPVGPVEVNAMLPATKKAATQRIEIKPGDNTLDLTIPFDAQKDYKKEAEPGKTEPGKAEPGKAEPGKTEPGKDAAKGAKDPKPGGPKGK